MSINLLLFILFVVGIILFTTRSSKPSYMNTGAVITFGNYKQ